MPRTRAKAADVIALLKADHDRFERAFKEFGGIDPRDAEACRALVMRTCEELKVHALVEEELLYPAVREIIDDEEILNEAAVEHETASMLIEQLENMDAEDPNYHATFTVLGEYVRHHIREEETEIFPQARAGNLDIDVLGARMQALREHILGDGERQHA